MARRTYTTKEREDAIRRKQKDRNDSKFGLRYLKSPDDLGAMNLGYFKAEEGDIFLALLPQPDDPCFYDTIPVHYDIGVNKDSFICLTLYGEQCPVCEYRKKLMNENAHKDVFKQFYPANRNLLFVIDMTNSETIAKGVQLYNAPNTVMDEILNLATDRRTGEITDLSDPDTMINVVFRREGKSLKTTKYTGFTTEDRKHQYPEKYLDDVVPFNEIIIEPDLDKMNEAVSGISVEDAVIEDRNDAPVREAERSIRREDTLDDTDKKPWEIEREESIRAAEPARESDRGSIGEESRQSRRRSTVAAAERATPPDEPSILNRRRRASR